MQEHALYHGVLKSDGEHRLAELFEEERDLPLQEISGMPPEVGVINLFSVGNAVAVNRAKTYIEAEAHLVAYSGIAVESKDLYWLDIHHSLGSKGNAVNHLRSELAKTHVVAFGDGDNDLSMFASADEAYAPANAAPEVLDAASQVIGHHDKDGVAHFLRERFNLN